MRVLVIAALSFALSAPAFAQEWVEFASRADRFSINFPAQPTVTETTYRSQFGADLTARVYSVAQGHSRYSVTVADYNNIEAILTEKAKSCPAGAETCRGGGAASGPGYSRADFYGAVLYATYQFLQRDAKVAYLGWSSPNLVEGPTLSLINNADKSRTTAGIYMHERKLYIIEGTVPDGYPEPGFFYQSVGWLDEEGNSIRYQTIYHHGFPRPSYRGGGQ
jgi:hypothetical protein